MSKYDTQWFMFFNVLCTPSLQFPEIPFCIILWFYNLSQVCKKFNMIYIYNLLFKLEIDLVSSMMLSVEVNSLPSIHHHNITEFRVCFPLVFLSFS